MKAPRQKQIKIQREMYFLLSPTITLAAVGQKNVSAKNARTLFTEYII